jgi:hypothetical protein
MYNLKWDPGQENLADYQSKHHIGLHNTAVRPWYLHLENSPRVLSQAKQPSALKGCVGTLNDGYIHKVPLPQAPRIQHTSQSLVETAQKCTSTFWVKSETRLRPPKMYQYILGLI